jgi:hypothetical protein
VIVDEVDFMISLGHLLPRLGLFIAMSDSIVAALFRIASGIRNCGADETKCRVALSFLKKQI